eukprot:TRINITY_DN2682_c0_g1_i1.p1 TRINITY_DN2682_c0_g1~~TRINITY_DN2682_c0_g1_i1.p1  ORF type:complete len:495 (+),score=85.03 TRINITY_DN2682_c0_g1_i1:259-1743(+)
MSFTSDEVNYLVYRYLRESGFDHTAFTFASESSITKNITQNVVPHGALISFLQKGLLYQEIETHLSTDGVEVPCDQPFSLIVPHVCKTIPRSKSLKDERDDYYEKDSSQHSRHGRQQVVDDDVDMGTPFNSLEYSEIQQSQVTVLEGHQSEVFICAWSPNSLQLASGSGDSTARIWSIPSGPCGVPSNDPPLVLRHINSSHQDKSKDVTTLDWCGDAQLLATGSYDGLARIWNSKGELVNTLAKHQGPIFSLKWNKKGDHLLSGSVDKTAIVWDAKSGSVLQQFEFHSAPTLDVDWRNNTQFATCSTDKMIYVCEIGKNKPVRAFSGHEDEVNAIKWDPSGSLLASCSDDTTAKIWSLKSDKPAHDFREHQKEIYTIKWSPTGPGSENPNKPLVLASASFDATIKVWDIDSGSLLHNLTRHAEPVYSVSFSPNGDFLASGSFDRCLHIWSVKDGSLVRTYRGSGGIFEVCWNYTGDKVAACFSNNTVCVIDFRV